MRIQSNRAARWFALVWAIGAYALLPFLPMGRRMTSSFDGTVTVSHTTLLSVEGPQILAILAVPMLAAALAFLPLPAARRQTFAGIGAAIATTFVVLGFMTVGLFFLPTAVALMVATRNPGTHVTALPGEG